MFIFIINYIAKTKERKRKRKDCALKIYMGLVQLQAAMANRPHPNADQADIDSYNSNINLLIEKLKEFKAEAIELGMKKQATFELPDKFEYKPKKQDFHEGGVIRQLNPHPNFTIKDGKIVAGTP